MLTFDWNALRVGDAVIVHDPATADLRLVRGTVASVDMRRVNSVAVRVERRGGDARTLWPARLTVHRAAQRSADSCWRCDDLSALPSEERWAHG